MNDRTYQNAIDDTAKARREGLAREIHDTAHPEPVMGCEECDLRYLDSLSTDEIGKMLDEQAKAARR